MLRTAPIFRLQNIFMIKSFLKKQILFLLIVFLYRFNRKLVVGKENLDSLDSFIVVTWHGKVLGLMEYLKKKKYYALVSQSRDGDLIVGVAKKFGYRFFRGSSSRGGRSALDSMNNFFADRKSAKIVITPDGPTGPEHKAKPGAFLLSQQSGRPIVPIVVDVKNSWKFKNWHTFYLSKPFSKMKIAIGKPLYFSKGDTVESGTKKIEAKLKEIDKIASNHE